MTNEELGLELAPSESEEDRAALVAKLSPERRAHFVRMIEIARQLNLHAAGLAPMPRGVIATKARGRFRRVLRD